MSEQLAFEKGFDNCRAVECDEMSGVYRAQLVQRSGDKVLPGARFTGNHHRPEMTGNALNAGKQVEHQGAAPDDAMEMELRGELASCRSGSGNSSLCFGK